MESPSPVKERVVLVVFSVVESLYFQHAAGATTVTIVQNGDVIADGDNLVQFTYEDARTPRLLSALDSSTASPLGNYDCIAFLLSRFRLSISGCCHEQ